MNPMSDSELYREIFKLTGSCTFWQSFVSKWIFVAQNSSTRILVLETYLTYLEGPMQKGEGRACRLVVERYRAMEHEEFFIHLGITQAISLKFSVLLQHTAMQSSSRKTNDVCRIEVDPTPFPPWMMSVWNPNPAVGLLGLTGKPKPESSQSSTIFKEVSFLRPASQPPQCPQTPR